MKKNFIILLLLFSLSGCKSKVYLDKTNDYLEPLLENIEVYTDIYLKDLVKVKNNSIIIEDKKIDTSELGQKDLVINYQVNKKRYQKNLKINIVDTTPPLVFSGTNKTVEPNYNKDLCNLITYGDNYTGDVKCFIEGFYDLTKEGTYKLIYTLLDSSQNTKKVNVTLNVKKPSSSSNSKPQEKNMFKDIYDAYKKDNTEIGIDVSKWQGEIDFQKVKDAKASFVMIRLAHQGKSKQELKLDEYFLSNLKKAKEAGLKVGIYLYSIATSEEEVINQAKFVIDSLKNEKLDLPIVFDWESWANWNSYKISFYKLNNIANTFMNYINNHGYDAMLYSSKFYLETIWTNKLNFPIWLAHYTKQTSYKGKYMLWQLCNNGKIDGINTDVDIDILYK